jgi:hypothetical protein
MSSFNWSPIESSGGGGVPTYATSSQFPAAPADGTVVLAKDTDNLYAYDQATGQYVQIGGPDSALALGNLDSETPNAAKGANLVNGILAMQSASTTAAGLVNTLAQGFTGVKTFSSAIEANGGVDVTSPQNTLSIGASATIINIGNSGATVNIQGTTEYQNVTNLNVANKLINLNTSGSAGSGANSGITVEENSVVTGYVETSSDRNSWQLLAPNTAGIATITPGASGITLNQSSHNPVTIGTANGLSLSVQVLSLGLASTSTTGALSATDWNTFNSKQSALTLGNLTSSDITVTGGSGAVVGSGTTLTIVKSNLTEATSSVLTITGGTGAVLGSGTTIQVLQASASQSGYLSSTDWSTFNGKQNSLTFGNITDPGTDGISITGGTGAVIGSGVMISQHVANSTQNGYLSSTDWSTFNSKQPAGSYITALTGDATASGPGSAALTLATVNSTTGSFGTATAVPTIVVNGKGLITSAVNTPIQIPESQVTNLTSDLASKIPDSTLVAKGSIITATAPSTPANLSVGMDGYVLTADSTQSTGLNWVPGGTAPDISMRYYSLSSYPSVSTTLFLVPYATLDYNDGSSLTYSAGTTTIGMAGKYLIQAEVTGTDDTYGDVIGIYLYQNGNMVSTKTLLTAEANAPESIEITDILKCAAGDTIQVYIGTGGHNFTPSSSNNFWNRFAIKKI